MWSRSDLNHFSFICCSCWIVLVFMVNIQTPSAAGQMPQDEVLRRLRNPDWRIRAIALQETKDDEAASDEALSLSLINALELDSLPGSSNVGADDLDYERYYSRLLVLVERIANTGGSPAAYKALVRSNWNPDSEIEKWLSHEPKSIEPALEMRDSQDETARANATYLLADLLKAKRDERCIQNATPGTDWSKLDEDKILSMLRSSAEKDQPAVRCNALLGLSLVGSQSDRGLINGLAQHGPPYIKYFADLALAKIEEGKTKGNCSQHLAPSPSPDHTSRSSDSTKDKGLLPLKLKRLHS
jgi:hypothetical protein